MLSFHQGFRQTPATAGNQQSEWPLLPVFLSIRDNGAGTGERSLHEAYVILLASFSKNKFGLFDYLRLPGITEYILQWGSFGCTTTTTDISSAQ